MEILKQIYYWFICKAYAADVSGFTTFEGTKGPFGTDLGSKTPVVDILDKVLTRFFEIAGGLALIALIVGAWQYLLAGGDQTRAEMGKKTLTWAITGIVLALLLLGILKAAMSVITSDSIITTQ